jgi:hypothetical protein
MGKTESGVQRGRKERDKCKERDKVKKGLCWENVWLGGKQCGMQFRGEEGKWFGSATSTVVERKIDVKERWSERGKERRKKEK